MPGTGRYRVRLAATPEDLHRAQRLRHLAFVEAGGGEAQPGRLDRDRFDALCSHVLIEERISGTLLGCFRLRLFEGGRALAESYTAQHYDLTALADRPGRLGELGRFCVHPALERAELTRPELIRLAWATVTRLVDACGVGLLFGCASFPGTDPGPHARAFAELYRHHLAPRLWRPGIRARDALRFETLALPPRGEDGLHLPPLLRSYLAMGGRVSDHAVRDFALNTLHVFVGLETARVPASRARALRALAG